MNVVKCKCIVKGYANGEPLICDTPVNFLTMVDATNGEITDPNHDLCGKTLKGKIFVFPYSVGSSVGAYILYSLKKNSSGPFGIICSDRMDITTASGCAISNTPAVHLKHNSIPEDIRNSRALTIDGAREQILIYSD